MKSSHLLTYPAIIAIVTIFSGLIYAAVQQSCRSCPNDLQLQIAHELSEYIKATIPLITL